MSDNKRETQAASTSGDVPPRRGRLVCDKEPVAYIITGLPMPKPPVAPDVIVEGNQVPTEKPDGN